MMNRLQLAQLQHRTRPSPLRPPAQSWRRTPGTEPDTASCACGGGCPRCLASMPFQATGQADTAPLRESRTMTIPFSVEIPASDPDHQLAGATRGTPPVPTGKVVHDEPGAPGSEAAIVPGHAGPALAPEEVPTPPENRADGTLYIEQMGGSPAIKDTAGVADSVSATFAYAATTTRGGVTLGASEFGQTTGSLKHFSNVAITPGAGKFSVTADLKQTVNWDTRATVGPNNQVDLTGENDADLTNANYATAASDLTPDVSDLKGRPPRTKFWAKDLTEQHEKYHVKDFVDIGKSSATDAETWLATQNAAKKEDVPPLLDTAWSDKIFKPWDKFTDPPAVEERAYDDGVASYKARADAIKAKGDKGGYP